MINIPHLETDLTVACQLSCVACNHLVVPYREKGKIWHSKPEQIEKDLSNLSAMLHASAWGALGGEPLLHPRLVDILKIVRGSNICDSIEVWTNGLLVLSRFPTDHEFWSCLDVLIVSRYQDKLTDTDVELMAVRAQSNGVKFVVKDERSWHNFRTNLEPFATDKVATKAKFDGCFFRQFSRVANDGYFYTCCCAPHQPVLLQGREKGSDGILIETATEETLREYLTREQPLGCCCICAGRDTALPVDWHEERSLDRWLSDSGMGKFC